MTQTMSTESVQSPEDHPAREFSIQLAETAWELDGYRQLRREVFCLEQRLFTQTDWDDHDAAARPIVAIGLETNALRRIVGAVRIYQTDPGIWYGSRLAVASDWRGVAGLSAGLIRKAVCTAHGLGCRTFLANVQRQNVPLFRRLHWKSIGTTEICGLAHHLMQADLEHYPPQALPALSK